MYPRTPAALAFKTATISRRTRTLSTLFPPAPRSLFPCHPTLLHHLHLDGCLFLPPFCFIRPFPSLPFLSLSRWSFCLFASRIFRNERVLFCSTGRDCLQACCVHKLCALTGVCVRACAPARARQTQQCMAKR